MDELKQQKSLPREAPNMTRSPRRICPATDEGRMLPSFESGMSWPQ